VSRVVEKRVQPPEPLQILGFQSATAKEAKARAMKERMIVDANLNVELSVKLKNLDDHLATQRIPKLYTSA
jgi:hypothetical protein